MHRSSLRESIASPPQTQQQLAATHADPGDRLVHSRLHAIVMQHLRHQHKAACLKAAAPISTLPPMSLLRPKSLPQVRCVTRSSQYTVCNVLRMLWYQIAGTRLWRGL